MRDMVSDTATSEQGMAPTLRLSENDWPVAALGGPEPVVLAVITGVDGPSYRPLGAAMAIDATGRLHGNLSSGCIDRDVALHARKVFDEGRPVHLRYGLGSPFMDMQLPCGGGLDITLVPPIAPDLAARITRGLTARQPVDLQITAGHLTERREDTGHAAPGAPGAPGTTPDDAPLPAPPFAFTLLPRLQMLIFGAGPEPLAFAAMAQAAGHLVRLCSPDPDTRDAHPGAIALGRTWPEDLRPDPRSAVCVFFHDHDHEPMILKTALASDAFYVGAQGSRRAHSRRIEALQDLGVAPVQTARLAHPFGLIPSVRDAQSLAVSVLAHVLEHARAT